MNHEPIQDVMIDNSIPSIPQDNVTDRGAPMIHNDNSQMDTTVLPLVTKLPMALRKLNDFNNPGLKEVQGERR